MHGPAGARRQKIASSSARRRAGIALSGAVALVASLTTATAVAGASSTVPHGGTAARTVACTAQALHARLETAPGFVASASGEAVSTVLLVNTGRRSCSLEGWPQLTLVAPSGAVHGANQIDTVDGAFGAVEPTALTLRPQGDAAFFVASPRSGACRQPFELRVGPPSAGATASLDASGLGSCSASESIEVSPIHPASLHLFQDYPAPAPAARLDPAARQRPAFAACRVESLHELRSTVVPERKAGYEEVEIFLQDKASSCSLRSRWPVVSLAGGGSVLVPAVRDVALLPADVVPLGGTQSPPTYVDLAHGDVALFDILVREPLSAGECRRATAVEVRLNVTPGARWSQVPAATYRPAVGIPACADETSLALTPSVSVTPITAVPDQADPLVQWAPAPALASPSGDAAGFGWAGDSSGGVCTGGTYPYGVEGLAKYGISGKCGGYFGQVGAAWSQWPGCPDSGWGWNTTDAAEAAANYPKYGVGNAFIYFTGGPGMRPPAATTLKSWADMQMANFASQAAGSQYRGYVDEPVVILDVETGYGWNDTVTDPTSGTLGCAFPIVTSGTYSAANNKALLSDMVSEASTVFPGYEVVVYTGGRYDWDPWFGSEAWTGGEYTFVNAIAGTPDGASGNVPGKFCLRGAKSPCAQFWGHESSSSAGALLWQWASPVPPSAATVDIDQVDEGHFPIGP